MTTATAKAPRKRRSRKSTAPINTSPAITVVNEEQPKVIITGEGLDAKVSSRPQEPNLKWDDYKADAIVRWKIHQYETKQLWDDCKWIYSESKPYVVKAVNYCKDAYQRAFEVKDKTDS